jgi:SAM-dependent methyltransferase
MNSREYYGIDAPSVVRNLALLGGVVVVAGVLGNGFQQGVGSSLVTAGICMAGAAAWMLVSSLLLKRTVMRSLLDERRWRGDETVLDVGCGQGLAAVEAARRIPRGFVHAIDLWHTADLSGNSPDALRANARAANIEDRLTIDTGDACNMPYLGATFDVVMSMTTIHNIPEASGRRAAIAEIWRVTKPSGQILIFDILYARSYLCQLRELGATDTKLSGPILLWGLIGWRFTARKPPDQLVQAQKVHR